MTTDDAAEPVPAEEEEAAETDRSPASAKTAYECPTCGAYAHQEHWSLTMHRSTLNAKAPDFWHLRRCAACREFAMWRGPLLVWPRASTAPLPHPDLPADVREIYDEARAVVGTSRRAAAALLRLALQTVIDELVVGDAKLDTKIGELVKSGLDPQVQQAMDVVRVVGNNAVHPGQIDVTGDGKYADALFELVNLVAEQVIARPRQVAELYASLPEGARKAIARRDRSGPDPRT